MVPVVQLHTEDVGRGGFDLREVNRKLREMAAEGKVVQPDSIRPLITHTCYGVMFAYTEYPPESAPE